MNEQKEGYLKGGLFFKEIMKRLRLFLLLILSVSLLQVAHGDEPTKAQKKAEKKKEQTARNAKKAEEKGRKRHESIQTKKVRKDMKRNRKRYNHVDSFDRRPNIIQRIFPRRRASYN